MKKFVAIAGNIGVGKSTLVELLSVRLGWEPFFEPVAENPYLADFYADMDTWSFHSQVFFLTHRLRAHYDLAQHPTSVVQGRIQLRDYQTYRQLYETSMRFLPPPDLVVYLRASVPTLMNRISMRGRDYERTISAEYLGGLNDLYEQWIDNFTLCPVLAVPADDLDYVSHPGHLRLITRKVEDKLTGKEEVVFEAEEMARAAED